MYPAPRQKFRLSGGTVLAFITAGDPSKPAVLLTHGFPGSADYFREVVPRLSQVAYVIAPDLPGFGASEVLPAPTFPAFGRVIRPFTTRSTDADRSGDSTVAQGYMADVGGQSGGPRHAAHTPGSFERLSAAPRYYVGLMGSAILAGVLRTANGPLPNWREN